MSVRLAIITSHPIQYNAPLFKLLSERNKVKCKVFYTWGQSEKMIYDPDFKIKRSWDIPLLEGYEYEFIENVSANPGSHHFNGIQTPSLINKILKWQPNFILIYGWSFSSHLAVLRKLSGKIPIIFRGDSTLLDEKKGFGLNKILRWILLKWIYSFVDIAVYTGKENFKYFKKYGLSNDQLVFGPHAIDNSRFHPNQINIEKGEKLRSELNIHENNIVLLFAGKFQSKKNPILLIDAINSINNDNIELVIVGDGVLSDELKNKASGNSKIHFLPFQNQLEMPSIYQMTDIFILPSQGPGETWGLSVNEAMASGKAIIITDKIGCSSDLVKNNENGFIIESGNLNELVKSIVQLSLNKKKVTNFGKASLNIIKSWNFDQLAEAIENVCLESSMKFKNFKVNKHV